MSIVDQIRGENLAAWELDGETVEVTISGTGSTTFERKDGSKEEKGVLYFKEYGTRGLVLNPTNIRELVNAYGTKEEAWTGKELKLFAVPTTKPDGTPTQGLRIRAR